MIASYTLPRWMVPVRVAPGTIRPVLVFAPNAGKACDYAERDLKLRYWSSNDVIVALGARREHRQVT